MKMKKIVATVLALLMMLALMTACKDDKNGNETSAPADESGEVSATTSEISDVVTGDVTTTDDSKESSAETETTAETTTETTDETTDNSISADVDSSAETVSTPDSSVADSSAPDVSENDTSAPESSEEDKPVEIPIGSKTYTVALINNGDGTVTANVYFPNVVSDGGAGKVVLSASSDLTYIEGSAKSDIGMKAINEKYPTTDGAEDVCISYASSEPLTAGFLVFSADYKLADGATLTEDDIISPEWKFTFSDGVSNTHQEDGPVTVVVINK